MGANHSAPVTAAAADAHSHPLDAYPPAESSPADAAAAPDSKKGGAPRKRYRDPAPVLDTLQPLVQDMVANVLLISRVTMGRGSANSAKRTASLLISAFVSRIAHQHDQLRAMNRINRNALDPCVFAMADHILCILWNMLARKYTRTLQQLHLSLEGQFRYHPTEFCVLCHLHETALLIFNQTMELVGAVNDAGSSDELALLLGETTRSMYVTVFSQLMMFKKAVSETPSAQQQQPPHRQQHRRSDMDFMASMVRMLEETLETVRAVDQRAILAAGSLEDQRPLAVATATHAAPAARRVHSASAMIALNVTRGAAAEASKGRSTSLSNLRRERSFPVGGAAAAPAPARAALPPTAEKPAAALPPEPTEGRAAAEGAAPAANA